MGDRANVLAIVEGPEGPQGIYLYTHSSGYRWPEALRQALEIGKGRWGDDQYLMRILISQMFMEIHDWEIGGGVSLVIGDNSYPIITADLINQTVTIEGGPTLSFADYVKQDRADYPGDTVDEDLDD